ncbi:MAG: hypothetical protein AABY32_05675 [Nanoarchaeota archaeon]
MKEKKAYSRIYDYRGHQADCPKISKYIEDNFIEGPITGSLLNSKQDYIAVDEDVLIKVTQNINETKEGNNYKSTITIEKVGPNAKKVSGIETFLLSEGFSPIKKNKALF